MEIPLNNISKFLFIALTVIIVSGCASSKGTIRDIQKLPTTFDLGTYDYLNVDVSNAPKVEMYPYEKERIRSKIVSKLQSLEGTNFKDFNIDDLISGTLKLNVEITSYDKGSAFARFMLMGLGQIHLDAIVEVFDESNLIGKYMVNKTFAGGGIHGGITTIEDVEEGLVEGIVHALSSDN